MFVILTSKIEEYDAQVETGLTIVKSFEYYFYNRKKALFKIARVDSEKARINIIETTEKGTKNSIPIKFFEAFDTLEAAEKELHNLTSSKVMDVSLRPIGTV